MDIMAQVLRWALDATTDDEREYYWALYDKLCERANKRA